MARLGGSQNEVVVAARAMDNMAFDVGELTLRHVFASREKI
jgi:hypothetical protein